MQARSTNGRIATVDVTSDQRVGRSSEPPLVAAMAGHAGLAMDVVRELLETSGVAVIHGDDTPGPTVTVVDVVVLVDPSSDDWAAARERDIPIVLVREDDPDDRDFVDAVLAGAEAVVHGDHRPATLVAVMAEVSRGGSVFRPAQARVLADLARAGRAQRGVTLSQREAQILTSIAAGNAVKQTARDLGISPKTVENLQGRLYRKLAASNRSQAVTRGHTLGLL